MKVAVLSDVHGNLPALEAVAGDIARWGADEVVVNGDLVNRGPCSLRCLDFVQRQWPEARCIKGNHESYVLAFADGTLDPAHAVPDIDRLAHWTCEQLGDAVEQLRDWGDHLDLSTSSGAMAHITHGSRLGNRDGIHPETGEHELSAKLGEFRELFVASHTHRPFVRDYRDTLLVNIGSVGQPFDGDPRAAYGRLSVESGRWRAAIRRVPFDRQRAERDFRESGFLQGAGPLSRLIYREFMECRIHVGLWRRQYLQAVKRGEIGVVEAVQHYLDSL